MKMNRGEDLHIRVSLDEKEKIANTAKLLGISISAYLRRSLLQEHIISKTDIQTVFEIKKIGVNLNQLTKHLNTLPVEDEIRSSISSIDKFIEELKLIIDRLK